MYTIKYHLHNPQMKQSITLKTTIFPFHASIIVMRTQFNSFCKGESMHCMNPCKEKCSLPMGLSGAVASKIGEKWGRSLTITHSLQSHYRWGVRLHKAIQWFGSMPNRCSHTEITICWWNCAHVQLFGGTTKTFKCLTVLQSVISIQWLWELPKQGTQGWHIMSSK